MESNNSNLRQYDVDSTQYQFYERLYYNQSLEFVLSQKEKYSKCNNIEMTIIEALDKLNDFIDPSDPDLPDIPNIIHAYQTAEQIRKKYPSDKPLQLTGLIHDLGKVLFILGEPDYSVVGDTFVVGAKIPESVVCYNKNMINGYDDLGIYRKHCGLSKLNLSYGHDEYLYQVLKYNSGLHSLPEYCLNIIRYHSFYPWHTQNEYKDFMKREDYTILEDVRKFNEFDLYSKEEKFVLTDDIKKYYEDLIKEYLSLEKYKF